MVSTTATSLRYPLAVTYFLAWASAVIVMGIVSYYISKYPRGQHVIYEEVIATIFTAFYLPSFAAPLMKSYRSWYLPLNIIFSHLWLTGFIFASQDYNRGGACQLFGPPGATNCHLKWANQAFLFLGFFFTLLAMILEILAYKSYDRSPIYTERKADTRPSGETGVTA